MAYLRGVPHQLRRHRHHVDQPSCGSTITTCCKLSTVWITPFWWPMWPLLLGEHLSKATFDDKRTSVLLFGGTMMAASLVFPWLWWALTRRPELRQPQVTEAVVRAGMRRNLLGLPTHSAPTLIAVWFPLLSMSTPESRKSISAPERCSQNGSRAQKGSPRRNVRPRTSLRPILGREGAPGTAQLSRSATAPPGCHQGPPRWPRARRGER